MLLLALMGCRALTEPAVEADRPAESIWLVGQVFGPDGLPLRGGEILIDNRAYERDEHDWVQLRVALDDEGRFAQPVVIGARTDVELIPSAMSNQPRFRLLGLETDRGPLILRHGMREIELPLPLPSSFDVPLEGGRLYYRQLRRRPADAPPYREDESVAVDSTATARGWVLPGALEVELRLEAKSGASADFGYPDSIRVLEQGLPALGAPFGRRELEIVLPQGLPREVELDCILRGTELGDQGGWRATSHFVVSSDRSSYEVVSPLVPHSLSFESEDIVLVIRDGWGSYYGGEPLPGLRRIELGEYWLEVRLPEELAQPELHEVVLTSGYSSRGASAVEGRALFLLATGSYGLSVIGPDREPIHTQTYSPTSSRVLQLDF